MVVNVDDILDVIELIKTFNSDSFVLKLIEKIEFDLNNFKKQKDEEKKITGLLILDRLDVILMYSEDENLIEYIENFKKHMENLIESNQTSTMSKKEPPKKEEGHIYIQAPDPDVLKLVNEHYKNISKNITQSDKDRLKAMGFDLDEPIFGDDYDLIDDFENF